LNELAKTAAKSADEEEKALKKLVDESSKAISHSDEYLQKLESLKEKKAETNRKLGEALKKVKIEPPLIISVEKQKKKSYPSLRVRVQYLPEENEIQKGSYLILTINGEQLIPYGYVPIGQPFSIGNNQHQQAFTNRMSDLFPMLIGTTLPQAKPSLHELALPKVMQELKLTETNEESNHPKSPASEDEEFKQELENPSSEEAQTDLSLQGSSPKTE
jgi:hypothetical protein